MSEGGGGVVVYKSGLFLGKLISPQTRPSLSQTLKDGLVWGEQILHKIGNFCILLGVGVSCVAPTQTSRGLLCALGVVRTRRAPFRGWR